jgi:hypothetical protein
VGDELDPSALPWGLDPAARAVLLRQAAQDALRRGDATVAALLAEEALDDAPEDVASLLVVADAAPRYGHAEVGLLAARQAARLGADTRVLQAAALLAACQVETALRSARSAREDSSLAEGARARAHAVEAQALELLGRDASIAYAAAHALRPDAYPRPLLVPEPAWDTLLQEALSALELPLRDVLRKGEILWREVPEVAKLQVLTPPPAPTADVLAWHEDPPRVECYRRNLVRGATSLDDVVRRLEEGLAAEARVLLGAEEES